MARPGNRHCASCIGTLSFPITLASSIGSVMCDSMSVRPSVRLTLQYNSVETCDISLISPQHLATAPNSFLDERHVTAFQVSAKQLCGWSYDKWTNSQSNLTWTASPSARIVQTFAARKRFVLSDSYSAHFRSRWGAWRHLISLLQLLAHYS